MLKLDEKFLGMELPSKFKFGISGCPNNCAEGWIKDFGAFGRPKGFTVVVGGNVGARPRIAQVLAEDLSADEVVALAEKAINVYCLQGKSKLRREIRQVPGAHRLRGVHPDGRRDHLSPTSPSFSRRLSARAQYSSTTSYPTQCLFSILAATQVVPEPQKGSRTTSPT